MGETGGAILNVDDNTLGGALERWFRERERAPHDFIIFTKTEMDEWNRMCGTPALTRHFLNEIVGVCGLRLRATGFPEKQAWFIPKCCFRLWFEVLNMRHANQETPTGV